MFGILVRARLRMLYNAARSAPATQKTVVSILSFLAMGLVFGIGAGTKALVDIAQDTGTFNHSGALTLSAAALVSKIYEYLFFFLLAGSVPFVATTLFQADDLNLLFTTPIVPRSVVGAKLVDAIVANGTQFMILGVPVLAGLGWAVGLGAFGWFWLVIATLFLLVIPPTATAAVLLIAAKVLGMRRVRIVVMLVSICLGLGITLLAIVGTNKITSVGRINYRQVRQEIQRSQAIHKTTTNAVVLTDNAPSWLPSTWAFEILQDTAGGHTLGRHGGMGLLRLALCGGLLVPFCLLLGQNVFSSEAFLETTDTSYIKPAGATERHPLLRLLPVQLAGMITKDIKYIKRDTILLGQIGTALILFLVPYLIRGTGGPNDRTSADLFGYLALAMLLLITYMTTSVISLTSIGLEGKSGWMVIGGPISRGALLRSKWILSFAISLSIVSILTLISWATFGWDWPTTVLAIGGWTATCFALSGLGVGLSGLFPRFIYENPAHRASVWALILGFYFSTGYIVACILIASVGYIAVLRSVASFHVAVTIGLLAFFAVSAFTGIVPVTLAERRLESYEWEL